VTSVFWSCNQFLIPIKNCFAPLLCSSVHFFIDLQIWAILFFRFCSPLGFYLPPPPGLFRSSLPGLDSVAIPGGSEFTILRSASFYFTRADFLSLARSDFSCSSSPQ
jgi:hypothetical protein